MSNTKNGERRVVSSEQSGSRRARSLFYCLLLTAYCLLSLGCRQDMQDQPRYEAYEPSKSFSDGQASRPYVEGTVARGYRDVSTTYYTGKSAAGGAGGQAGGSGSGGLTPMTSANSNAPNAQGAQTGGTQTGGDVNVRGNVSGNVPGAGQSGTPGGVNEFPFAITAAELDRGEERFNIYCSMCHGQTGYGDGMIVRRGFRRPPSLHDDRLRNESLGHFFDVITNGWGAMPSYTEEIPPRDRWAIIAYIRALQLSQNTPAAEVPENLRNQRRPGPGTPTTEGGHQGTGGERTP